MSGNLTEPMREMLSGYAAGRPSCVLLDRKRGAHGTLRALETRGLVKFIPDGGINGVVILSGDYAITEAGRAALAS